MLDPPGPGRNSVAMAPEAGSTGTITHVVSDDDTAVAVGSGEVDVLATPRLLAWCEAATCEAVAGSIPEDRTTVGIQVMVDHFSPSPVGAEVEAEAVLEKVHGKKLFFTVSAHDERGLVAAGRITRMVVDTEAFLAKLQR